MTPPLHSLPKHPEKWFPKYNINDGLPAKENLDNFMLVINLNGFYKEDVVCKLFPYTFEGSMGSWYFSSPSRSITNWDTFEEQFLNKFGHDRTITTLINQFSNLKTSPNDKVKDFNSRFNNILNQIPTISNPGVVV